MINTVLFDKLDIYFKNKSEKDYTNIMRKAQNDKKFEKLVKDMTVNTLTGSSALNKNKIKF